MTEPLKHLVCLATRCIVNAYASLLPPAKTYVQQLLLGKNRIPIHTEWHLGWFGHLNLTLV